MRAGEEKERRQDAIVEGEDAERTSRVEVAKIVGVTLGVEQEAGDGNPRQNEEEIDTEEAIARRSDDQGLRELMRGGVADEVDGPSP